MSWATSASLWKYHWKRALALLVLIALLALLALFGLTSPTSRTGPPIPTGPVYWPCRPAPHLPGVLGSPRKSVLGSPRKAQEGVGNINFPVES